MQIAKGTANDNIEGLEQRLAFMHLDTQAIAALKAAAPVIARELATALDDFYLVLAQHPVLKSYFKDKSHMERAKAAQMLHWNAIVAGKLDEGYIASVRRIGETHAHRWHW